VAALLRAGEWGRRGASRGSLSLVDRLIPLAGGLVSLAGGQVPPVNRLVSLAGRLARLGDRAARLAGQGLASTTGRLAARTGWLATSATGWLALPGDLFGLSTGWKACRRSYFATWRPSTTPATPEKS
jgi:hypothetical protein